MYSPDGMELLKFLAMVWTQFGKCVKIIHIDNGIEFRENSLVQLYDELRMWHQTSYTNTPQ